METVMATGAGQLLRKLPEGLRSAANDLLSREGSDKARVAGAAALVAGCTSDTERELVSNLLRCALDDRALFPTQHSGVYGQILYHVNQIDFARFPGQLPGGNW